MTDLDKLIADLEAATGPDRELDATIPACNAGEIVVRLQILRRR